MIAPAVDLTASFTIEIDYAEWDREDGNDNVAELLDALLHHLDPVWRKGECGGKAKIRGKLINDTIHWASTAQFDCGGTTSATGTTRRDGANIQTEYHDK